MYVDSVLVKRRNYEWITLVLWEKPILLIFLPNDIKLIRIFSLNFVEISCANADICDLNSGKGT